IPVFHDDQHGTAIISAAGLLNALELVDKKIENIKVVVNGAGASAISCSKLYISIGVKKENVIMCDTKGVIHKDRTDLNKYKKQFITDKNVHSLEEALVGADVFLGLSVANVMSPEMLKSMAKDPIVFAMANPNPEISYEKAIAARKDLIFATGRSDHPNQINNVLGFPFIFRGALDIRATIINEEMKIAAVKALAELTKEDVPETVNTAYKAKNLSFGREYIIPKPLDPRLITRVAPAVAKAAMDSGVAGHKIEDWDKYHNELRERVGLDNQLIRDIRQKAKNNPKKVAFGEAANYKVLKAAQEILHSGFAVPVLLGNEEEIHWLITENNLEIGNIEIIDPKSKEEEYRRNQFADKFYKKRQRKGLNKNEAVELMYNLNYFGSMMVETGQVDAFLSGFSSKYADVIRPAIQIAGLNNKENHIAGMYIVQTKKGSFFFSDTTVNIQPSVETIVDTTLLTARTVERFGITPKIAIVSYSNFGSNKSGSPSRAHDAVKILHKDYPDLIVDGEMQANFAFNKELRQNKFPFSKLADMDVNTIIFPNLSSGNIAYKMMQEIGGAEVIGPILMGLGKPIHILQLESSVREIVNMATIAVIDAQCHQDPDCE
ncbi:MAG: NADP-dependent malic enzyme, partial [Bacteroidales bacterium]|nr:NADP-dependent malic enzyme [Bacteroidales bacterium]